MRLRIARHTCRHGIQTKHCVPRFTQQKRTCQRLLRIVSPTASIIDMVVVQTMHLKSVFGAKGVVKWEGEVAWGAEDVMDSDIAQAGERMSNSGR